MSDYPEKSAYTKGYGWVLLGLLLQSDRYDVRRLIDELVPCKAAMTDDIAIGCEVSVG